MDELRPGAAAAAPAGQIPEAQAFTCTAKEPTFKKKKKQTLEEN